MEASPGEAPVVEVTKGEVPVVSARGTFPVETSTREVLVEVSTREAPVESTIGEASMEASTAHEDAAKPLLGSIERGVKACQIKKRRAISSSFTHTYRKSRAKITSVVPSTQDGQPSEEVLRYFLVNFI